MDVRTLSETRKKDRAEIAALVCATLSELKIDHTWTREGFDECYKKAHVIKIEAPQGLRLQIEIDGDSCQPNVHVLPWNFSLKSDTCFADAFGAINQCHYRKATLVAYGTDGLLAHLREKLTQALDGSAFSPERTAEAVAKDGTWQEREARWEKYREEFKAEQIRKGEAA